MEDLFDFNSQKNQIKELSPHTYYKPFTSSFDREFLLYKFEKKPEEPKRNNIQRKQTVQPSWSSNNSLVDPNSPCTSDDSFNTGSELSVHSKPFFPEYYTERNQILHGDSLGLPSNSSFSANNYNFIPEKEQTHLHDYSLSFYNSNIVSPIEKLNATLDLSSRLRSNRSFSSKFGTLFSPEEYIPFRQNSLSFEDNLNESLQGMDNISISSSQDQGLGHAFSNRRRGKKEPPVSGYTKPMICNFCKNNKEVPDIFLNHYLYDPVTKVLSCPVLRKHVCQVCGETGDSAHTLQYCPVNREKGLIQGKVAVLLKTRTVTNSTGKLRRN